MVAWLPDRPSPGRAASGRGKILLTLSVTAPGDLRPAAGLAKVFRTAPHRAADPGVGLFGLGGVPYTQPEPRRKAAVPFGAQNGEMKPYADRPGADPLE